VLVIIHYELGSLFVFILMCYTYIYIEGLRKTMKNLSEQSVPGSRTEDRTCWNWSGEAYCPSKCQFKGWVPTKDCSRAKCDGMLV